MADAPGASDEVEERRDNLPPVETVLNLATFERMAKEVLGEESRAWRYFYSYSDDGVCKCLHQGVGSGLMWLRVDSF